MLIKKFSFLSLFSQWSVITLAVSQATSLPASLLHELSHIPAPDQCKTVLQKFSNSSSAFTKCANEYAKPIFMCRNCVHDFLNVRTFYYALEHAQSEGINCKDLLTSQDKVEIIKATFNYIVADDGLWAKGFCSSCYTSPLNHTSNLTENTLNFFALYKTVSDCFEAHPNSNSTENEKSEACTQCAIDYYNLLDFYKQNFLREQFPYLDGICFDILDAMNSTQHKWGTGHFHCGRQLKGNVPLIAALLVVLMTPIAFYVLTRFGPGTRRAQERVLTQRHYSNFINRAQEENNDQPPSISNSEVDTEEEAVAGPSSAS